MSGRQGHLSMRPKKQKLHFHLYIYIAQIVISLYRQSLNMIDLWLMLFHSQVVQYEPSVGSKK